MTRYLDKSLTIGIVTHNHAAFIAKALEDIEKHIQPVIQTRVVVWDNCSKDDTVSLIEEYKVRGGLDVELFVSDRNTGFGQGHNKILHRCSADYHLIYNPDLYATEGCLEPLLDVLEECAEVEIAAPRFVYPNGALQPLCRRDPSVLDLLLRFTAVGPLKAMFAFYLNRGTLLDIGYDKAMDVPITSGALMCFRTRDLKALEGFDQRFFVYFEDYDLCRRVRRKGKRIRYTPASRFIHEWKRESRKSFKAVKMLLSGARLYFQIWGVRWI